MFQGFEKYFVLATNIAVLIGLALLVYELRQNRESIEIETQFSIADAAIQTHTAVATDPELAQLISVANRGHPAFSQSLFHSW